MDKDPDADRRSNLFEYAIGGFPQPGTNSPAERTRFQWVDHGGFQGLEYRYDRRPAMPTGASCTTPSRSPRS